MNALDKIMDIASDDEEPAPTRDDAYIETLFDVNAFIEGGEVNAIQISVACNTEDKVD